MDALVAALQGGLGFFYYILVYGIGILAMTLTIVAYQFRRRVTILLCSCAGQIFWILYFFLQGDLASATACALSAVMLAIFSRKEKWRWVTSPVTIAFFLVLMTATSLASFRGWQDIFPVLAGVFGVLASSRATEKRLRQLSIPWCLFWLCNSIVKFYPVALITDFCSTLSAAIALWRYRETKNKKGEK